MYGLAAIAAGNILSGYGDAQSASAARNTLGDAYDTQQRYNAENRADLEASLPQFGAPALRGDIAKAEAPIVATQKQNRMLGSYLGRDLGPNAAPAVQSATGDAIRRGGYGVSAFGLRRGQEMQGRSLGDLMSRRARRANKAEGQANLLPYQLRAAAMKGNAMSDMGQLVSTAGSLWAASGKGGGGSQGDPGRTSATIESPNATDGMSASGTYIDPETGLLMARV